MLSVGCSPSVRRSSDSHFKCCHVSSVKCDTLISNGHLNDRVHGYKASNASGAMHRMHDPYTGCYSESLGCVGHVQWYLIRRSLASDTHCRSYAHDCFLCQATLDTGTMSLLRRPMPKSRTRRCSTQKCYSQTQCAECWASIRCC
jgi:hypothetical protein